MVAKRRPGSHEQLHFLRKERISFVDQAEAHKLPFEALMPAEVDDEYIHEYTIESQPPGTTSLVTGFNLNSCVFVAAYKSSDPTKEPCPCARSSNIQLQIKHLQDRLGDLKYMLDDIPASLQPWVTFEESENRDENSSGDKNSDLQTRRGRYEQFAIMRANLHVTHLWFQNMLSMQLDGLLDSQVQSQLSQSPSSPEVGASTEIVPIPPRDVKLVWAEREDLCRQLLHLLHGISNAHMEPSGLIIVCSSSCFYVQSTLDST